MAQEQRNDRVLLDLCDVLISSSSLHCSHKVALGIASQRLLQQQATSGVAVQLILAIGRCCSVRKALQKHIANLVSEQALVPVLLSQLDHTTTADPQAATALIRAVRWLVLQQACSASSTPRASTAVSPPIGQAAAWLGQPQHHQRLLQAACTSTAAAEAVAALAVSAACSCLPAASLLQSICTAPPQIGRQAPMVMADAAPATSRKAWLTMGLQPLLTQIQAQLQLYFGAADNYTYKTGPVQQPSTPAGFQQLWLLLCAAMRTADGQLLDAAVLQTVVGFFSDPAATQAWQTALLASGTLADTLYSPAGAGHTSSAAGGSSSGGGGGSSRSARQPATGPCSTHLRACALQLVSHVAGHSVELARQCFNVLAPIMPQVLMACGDTAAPTTPGTGSADSTQSEAAAASARDAGAERVESRAAVLQVWQQLLLKGRCSFPGALRALLQQTLPAAADALTAAAAQLHPGSPSVLLLQQQSVDKLQQADAVAAVFVALAGATEACNKPLLSQQRPGTLLNTLTGHVPALARLLQAAAAQSQHTNTTTSAPADSPAADAVHSVDVPGWVLLLATWLLHSWVAALQEYAQEQPGTCAPWKRALLATSTPHPASGSPPLPAAPAAAAAGDDTQAVRLLSSLWPQLVASVAALLSCHCDSSSALQLRCQTEGLGLVRVLVGCQELLLHPHISTACYSCSRMKRRSSSSGGGGPTAPPLGPVAAAGAAAAADVRVGVEEGSSSAAMTSIYSCGRLAASSSSGCVRGCCSAVPWQQQLLLAVSGLFHRSPKDPMNLAHRQLLQTACQVLSQLAAHKHTLCYQGSWQGLATALKQQQVLAGRPACVSGATHSQHAAAGTAAAAAAGGGGGSPSVPVLGLWQQRGGLQEVWCMLWRDLCALRDDLAARKLARSSSREELLLAVDDLLQLLEQEQEQAL